VHEVVVVSVVERKDDTLTSTQFRQAHDVDGFPQMVDVFREVLWVNSELVRINA
jgi:hypothetical protein